MPLLRLFLKGESKSCNFLILFRLQILSEGRSVLSPASSLSSVYGPLREETSQDKRFLISVNPLHLPFSSSCGERKKVGNPFDSP